MQNADADTKDRVGAIGNCSGIGGGKQYAVYNIYVYIYNAIYTGVIYSPMTIRKEAN